MCTIIIGKMYTMISIFAVIDTALSKSVIKTQLIGSQYLRLLTYGLAITGKEQYNVM